MIPETFFYKPELAFQRFRKDRCIKRFVYGSKKVFWIVFAAHTR